jgi:hypothetical protein
MPSYGQITGTDHGVEGRWLIELDADGAPISEFPFTLSRLCPMVCPHEDDHAALGRLAGRHRRAA